MNNDSTMRQTPSRRTLLLGGLTLVVTACGFAPRGSVELPPLMQRLHLGGKTPDPAFTSALQRLLAQNGGRLVGTPAEASLRLTIEESNAGRRQAILDPRARLRQVELTQTLIISAQDAAGHPLLKNERLEASRMMHYDPANLLAAGEDEARLRHDMQETLAQALLARLRAASLTP